MPAPVSVSDTATKGPEPPTWPRIAGMAPLGGYSDRQRALAVHGIARVHGHVDERRLELARIGLDDAALRRPSSATISMREPTTVRSMSAIASDPLPRIEDLGLQRLPPRESEQLAGELGGAVDRIGDRIHVAAAPLLGGGRVAAGGRSSS